MISFNIKIYTKLINTAVVSIHRVSMHYRLFHVCFLLLNNNMFTKVIISKTAITDV
jgi:hypothetical protein